MINPVDIRLHFEELFRITSVRTQTSGHLRFILIEGREQRAVRADYRIGRIEDVDMRLAIVGVDGRLYRIPHVIDAVISRNFTRKRIRVRRGVTIQHPDLAALGRDHQIRILAPLQIGRESLQPVAHLPVNHHAAVLCQITGQHDSGIAEMQSRGGPHEQRRDGEAALALIPAERIVRALRIIEFLLGCVHKHRLLLRLAVIEFRSRQLQARSADLRGHVLDQINRLALRRDLRHLRHHQTVPVRVEEVQIDPVRLRGL